MKSEGQRIHDAEEAFFKANEAIDDSTTLGAPSPHNQYMRNRLLSAFRDGWDAAKRDGHSASGPRE